MWSLACVTRVTNKAVTRQLFIFFYQTSLCFLLGTTVRIQIASTPWQYPIWTRLDSPTLPPPSPVPPLPPRASLCLPTLPSRPITYIVAYRLPTYSRTAVCVCWVCVRACVWATMRAAETFVCRVSSRLDLTPNPPDPMDLRESCMLPLFSSMQGNHRALFEAANCRRGTSEFRDWTTQLRVGA